MTNSIQKLHRGLKKAINIMNSAVFSKQNGHNNMDPNSRTLK